MPLLIILMYYIQAFYGRAHQMTAINSGTEMHQNFEDLARWNNLELGYA